VEIDFISCAVRREGLGILNSTGRQPSPIGRDTESWVYASNVREKYLRVVFAGNTTGWSGSGKDNIGLRAESRRVN